MTRRNYLSIALTIVYILFSMAVHANENTGRDNEAKNSVSQESKQADHAAGKQAPAEAEEHSKAPHGKTHTPHSEELPHIHKFHKERVKKIKKHHGKCWFLSQVILFLCHAAILYMSYLHAAH